MNKWTIILLAVLFSIVINQGIDEAQTYFNNRQYDMNRIQTQWEKDWDVRIEQEKQKLRNKGMVF